MPDFQRFLSRLAGWPLDLAFALFAANLVAMTLGIAFLNSPNSPTGGDAASHLLYAQLYADGLLASGHILPWVPEVFGGLPFLSYYFPLPFIVIALLSKPLGLAVAFKWGGFLALMLLPGAAFTASRRWFAFGSLPALFAGLGALAYLLHEQNSIWGGNLLSTLAGEFAYSYGMFFALLALLAWARAIHRGHGWLLAALLEAACGFSHGFPLLVVGFSSAFLLLDGLFAGSRAENRARFWRSFRMLAAGHTLAFCLLGGWLWPMLEMHSLTIPNDASFPLGSAWELLPETLRPVYAAGFAGLLLLAVPAVRRHWQAASGQRLVTVYLTGAAALSAVFFLAGDQLGLADIRFFPPVWLLTAIIAGWLAGQALSALIVWLGAGRGVRLLLAAAATLALLGWFGTKVQKAPDWGLWNHSGLEAKPQWRNLSQLFPVLSGDLWSPRLAFEHDPANNDLGSTRSLEALPMFLQHRPVLEGLYMESAVLGPAIYLLQSEISASPSSPLVRFPSGSLDPDFAVRHLNFLHADTILLRSERAKAAIEASGHFERTAVAPPFAVYRLKHFTSALAEVVTQPVQVKSRQDWMQDAFAWFRTRSRFESWLPVYSRDPAALTAQLAQQPAGAPTPVAIKSLDRHEMVFATAAVGRPHLIKVAYHPRWQLASQGSLHIGGPGYLLVVPEEAEIRLVYGSTLVGKLGIAASLIAALTALVLLWRGRRLRPLAAPLPPGGLAYWLPIAGLWLLLAAAAGYYATFAPERIYAQGWEEMNASRFAAAAERFRLAYDLRKPPAKREEALFWHAKASENAGRRAEALAAYRELIDRFHGFWLPETLYTVVTLSRQDGRAAEVEPLARRLNEEYPNNPWTLRLNQGQ